MDSALTIGSSISHFKTPSMIISLKQTPTPPLLLPSNTCFPNSKPFNFPRKPRIGVIAFSKSTLSMSPQNRIIQKLKTTARLIILAAAATSMVGKFRQLPARADSPLTLTKEIFSEVDNQQEKAKDSSTLLQFLRSNSKAIDKLSSLLQQKLEDGEDEEASEMLKVLVAAQPEQTEWRFRLARLLNKMGKTQEARDVLEDILMLNPLSSEALFENALCMDRCGEGEAVITRLEKALRIAEDQKKVKEARDVRLIIAQIQFLQKNVEEALRSYKELAREDPKNVEEVLKSYRAILDRIIVRG